MYRICMLLTVTAHRIILWSWTAWKLNTTIQQLFTYWEPDTSKSPILVCSFPSSPTPPAVCPCFIVAVCPSLPPSLAAWGTDFAADKAATAAGRAKQYPGAHCSTAYATKHGWRQPKGQAPRYVSAGVYVSVWCVCHLYPLPLSILIRRIGLVFTHGCFKQKSATSGIFSTKDFAVASSCLFNAFGYKLHCHQLSTKYMKCLEYKITSASCKVILQLASVIIQSVRSLRLLLTGQAVDWVILCSWRVQTDAIRKWDLKP